MSAKFWSVFASVALTGLAAQTAIAADMPVKAIRKAPIATVYDWTGLYFGVNAGVGVGRNSTFLSAPNGPSFERSYLSPQGGLIGGQIGFNWQSANPVLWGPLVLGVEADIQRGNLNDDYSCLLLCATAINAQFSQKLDWFGTVRARAGVASGPVLTYITGGWAYGHTKTTLNESIGTTAAFSTSRSHGGWTWGSGVEASLGGNWTGKFEYLYLDLGNRSDAFVLNGFPQTLTTETREHIFRAGLNYSIGGNRAAYVAPAPANWAGFYAGGNVGAGVARDRSSFTAAGPGGITEAFNLSPKGINGGVLGGYNWQTANWVFGIEADIQASGQRDNNTCVLTCSLPAGFFAYDATLPWFGTARGRLGYSLGSTLFYATAGYAFGKVKTAIDYGTAGGPGAVVLSNTRSGWTAGGGIESPLTFLSMFGRNWTVKTEYLYVDLGTSTADFTTPPATPVVTTTRVQEHIFRTGLNYHFNGPVAVR